MGVLYRINLGLRPSLLVVIIIYFLYIEFIGRENGNWDRYRKFCYAQNSLCAKPSNYVYLNDDFPACKDLGARRNHQVCYSTRKDIECAMSLPYSEKDLQARLSATNSAAYFGYAVVIIILSCLALLCCFLFDDNNSRAMRYVSANEGAFHSGSLSYVTVVLLIIIIALIIGSGASFNLMQNVLCGDRHSSDSVCADVSVCNSRVMSYINPNNMLVREYQTICIVIASLVFVQIIGSFYLYDRNAVVHAENDVSSEGSFVSIEEDDNLPDIENRAMLNHSALRYSTAAQRLAKSLRSKQGTGHWEFFSSSDPAAANVQEKMECAICLSNLFIMGDSTSRSATANDTIAKVQCGHFFHKSCLTNWCFGASATKMTCPVCRADISK